jgi:hypothetical protein
MRTVTVTVPSAMCEEIDMSTRQQPLTALPDTWEYVRTRTVNVGGTKFAYRALG